MLHLACAARGARAGVSRCCHFLAVLDAELARVDFLLESAVGGVVLATKPCSFLLWEVIALHVCSETASSSKLS